MRRWLCLGVLLVVAASLPVQAVADGDPASDILLTENTYVPAESLRGAPAAGLQKAVAAAYARGFRVKVAVIATKVDLGAVPQLFGSPNKYASFLGKEIAFYYIGPLLVVMPNGFGLYDGGRSTAAERRALKTLTVSAGSPDALIGAATSAVRRLTATGALRSKDILGPTALPLSTTVQAGQPAKLGFKVLEDSERASAVATIYAGDAVLATLRMPLRHTVYADLHVLTWKAPDPLPAGPLRFCVVATDAAGNRGRKNCLPIQPSK